MRREHVTPEKRLPLLRDFPVSWTECSNCGMEFRWEVSWSFSTGQGGMGFPRVRDVVLCRTCGPTRDIAETVVLFIHAADERRRRRAA